jgi:hypothetical protein
MPARELRIDHLSHSSISLYAECGRAWYGKYVDGLATPTTPALLVGAVFDQVLERTLRAKTAGLPVTEDSLTAQWESAWREHTEGEQAGFIDWQGMLPEAVENQGRRLVTHKGTWELLQRLAPLDEGERGPALQRRVELRVPGVPIPLVGYVDVITADGTAGDFKTASRAWPSGRARREIQPRLYLAALQQERWPLRGLRFRHWIWTKTRTTELEEITTEYSASELFAAVEAVRMAWLGITAGVFMPNARAWFCGERCPVWQAGQCLGAR